tara:strand:- start:1829 stop:2833 length:1005 start_codon:yes stop_codon:yes gene_type:complete
MKSIKAILPIKNSLKISLLISLLPLCPYINPAILANEYFNSEPEELKSLYRDANSKYVQAFVSSDPEKQKELYKIALKKINFLLKVAPRYSKAFYLRSKIKLKTNITIKDQKNIDPSFRDLQGAIDDTKKAIDIDPDNYKFYDTRAEIYEELFSRTLIDRDKAKNNTGCSNLRINAIGRYYDCKELNDQTRSEILSEGTFLINMYHIASLRNYDKSISLNKLGKDNYKDKHQASSAYFNKAMFYFRSTLFFNEKSHNKALKNAILNLNQAIKLSSFKKYRIHHINILRMRAITFFRLNNLKAACDDINLIKGFDPSYDFKKFRSDDFKKYKDNC